MDAGSPQSAATGRSGYLVHELLSGVALFGYAGAALLGMYVSAVRRDGRLGWAAFALAAALVAMYAWTRAKETAADRFFVEFAPTLGLRYVDGWNLPVATPLLAAGGRRRNEHAMLGPLYGPHGGPECSLSHYTYEVAHETADRYGSTITVYEPHVFTVCVLELPQVMANLRTVYLRRRPRLGLTVSKDWLDGWSTAKIDMESAEFERRYELRAGPDQERLVVSELFQPSFVLWLAEHPLRPGFELRDGTLAVFVPGALGDPARLTQLLDAAREITWRVTDSPGLPPAHFSAAGQTIL